MDKSNGDQLQLPITIPSFELRVFISSTFSDTKQERDLLMESVLPELQLRARAHGVQIIVVDMRYGVPDENTRDHLTWTACEKALQACISNSEGIFCLSMQGMKYGYRPLPKYLAKIDFEERLRNASKEDADLASSWYTIDENNVPAVYVLRRLDGLNDAVFWEVVKPRLLKFFNGIKFYSQALGDIDGGLEVGQSMTEWETRVALYAKTIRQQRTFNVGNTIHRPLSRPTEQFVFIHRKFRESADDILEKKRELDKNISALQSKASACLERIIGEYWEATSVVTMDTRREAHTLFENLQRVMHNLRNTEESEVKAGLQTLKNVLGNTADSSGSDSQECRVKVTALQDKIEELSRIIDFMYAGSSELRELDAFCDSFDSDEERIQVDNRLDNLIKLIQENLDEEYIEVGVEKSVFERFQGENGNANFAYFY